MLACFARRRQTCVSTECNVSAIILKLYSKGRKHFNSDVDQYDDSDHKSLIRESHKFQVI